jgi:hypothetical protein
VYAAEVYVDCRAVVVGLCRTDSAQQLADSDGLVVVDACLFGLLQLVDGTFCDPLASQFGIVEPDGTYSPRRVSVFADLATWCVGTEQATGSFVVNMYHSFVV